MTEVEKYKLSTYRQIGLLHETEMAKVELVECSLDGVKYVKKSYHSDKREIFRILASITSAYIPQIKEVFFGEDTIVIEEYIEGKSAEDWVKCGKQFTLDEVRLIMSNLLLALNVLHKNNIIHRDIKPENVIIRENGQAVLVDYGIARKYEELQNADTELLGTIGYAAPEQYGFSQSDYRTDIYSFGMTMKAIAGNSKMPRYLSKLIEKCAEFDPKNRFQSVLAIQRCLRKRQIAKRVALGLAVMMVLGVCITTVCLLIVKAKGRTPLVYGNVDNRLIDVYSDDIRIPCLQVWEDGTYSTKLALDKGLPKTEVEVHAQGKKFTLTINEEYTFSFEDTYIMNEYSYPHTKSVMEVNFYDINRDGVLEIMPVVGNAGVYVDDWGEVWNLKNDARAFCIYYEEGDYHLAEGVIVGEEGDLRFYWGDGVIFGWPAEYELADGVIREVEY